MNIVLRCPREHQSAGGPVSWVMVILPLCCLSFQCCFWRYLTSISWICCSQGRMSWEKGTRFVPVEPNLTVRENEVGCQPARQGEDQGSVQAFQYTHLLLQCPNNQIVTEVELILPSFSHLKLVHLRLISSFRALWVANKEKQHLQRTINLILSDKPELSGGVFGSGFVFLWWL